MNDLQLAPWLQTIAVQRLSQAAPFPQSLLISGQEGVGKADLAEFLASSLLCDNPTEAGESCGQCQQCLLFRAGNHPDFHVVLTEKETMGGDTRLSGNGFRYLTDNQKKPGRKSHSESILIDQIRSVAASVVATPQLAKKTVVLISPAEKLNRNAANSLLKILEEPVGTSFFLLISHRSSALPATIRSRCQHISIPLPEHGQACDWLAAKTGLKPHESDIILNLAAGAPATALKLNEQGLLSKRSEWLKSLDDLTQQSIAVSTFANQWKKADSRSGLLWFYGWLRDLIVLKAGQENDNRSRGLFNADCLPTLQIQAKRLNLRQLMACQSLVEQRFALLTTSNADDALVLEEVLGYWNKMFYRRRQ